MCSSCFFCFFLKWYGFFLAIDVKLTFIFICLFTLSGLGQDKEIARKRTLLSIAEHSSLLANSLSQYQRLAVAKTEDKEEAVANNQHIRQSSNDTMTETCTGKSNTVSNYYAWLYCFVKA